jgi:hypothetical protein
LEAVISNGVEVERLKSAEPEKPPPQSPASEIEHVNGQFTGSGFAKMVSRFMI